MDWSGVSKLLGSLKTHWRGLHEKIAEVEALKHFEDPTKLQSEEKVTGLEVRVGLTADLIEQVKSALTTNRPRVKVEPYRSNDKAKKNSDNREAFWGAYLASINRPLPVIS